MAEHLNWNEEEQEKQMTEAMAVLNEFGGPVPNKEGAQLTSTTVQDLHSMFKLLVFSTMLSLHTNVINAYM